MIQPHFRTLLASAAIIALAGCAALPGDGQKPATDAVETAPAAPVAPGGDLLTRLPQDPWAEVWGADIGLILSGTLQDYAALELGTDQEGIDLTEAVRVAGQLAWVATQRDTLLDGRKLENVRAHVTDVEHFAAPSARDHFKAEADEMLSFMEAKEAGSGPELAAGDGYAYTIYPGTVYQADSPETPEEAAAWPDYADEAIWLKPSPLFGGPEPVRVPVLKDAKGAYKNFLIGRIYDAPAEQDPTHAVVIETWYYVDVPLANGQTASLHVMQAMQVGYEENKWALQDSNWTMSNIFFQ